MSYTRPPFDAADASWVGAAVYARSAPNAADATWMDDAPRVDCTIEIQTSAPIPAAALSARLEQVIGAQARIQTVAPIPQALVNARAHVFEPYVAPALVLTLPCQFYVPRPLDCPVYLDIWQPPCFTIVAVEIAIPAPAPIPAATLSARAFNVQPSQARISAQAPIPIAIVAGSADQDLALPDASASGVQTWHQAQQIRVSTPLAATSRSGFPAHTRLDAKGQQAGTAGASIRAAQTDMLQIRRVADLFATDGIRVTGFSDATHTETLRFCRPVRADQGEAIQVKASASAPHAEKIYTRNRLRTEQQDGRRTSGALSAESKLQGIRLSNRLGTPATDAMRPPPGRWWPWYEPPSLTLTLSCLPDYQPRPLNCDLWLCSDTQPYCPDLDDNEARIVVPIRRVYYVLNTVTLSRVSDGTPIDCSRINLSIDDGSWTWSWSASIPGNQLELIYGSGEPQELLATINGEPIRLRIDLIQRTRVFGSSMLAVSGRGRAAVLADPVAARVSRYNSETRTAQQLIGDALTDNGVSIGWTVDWGLEDWSVPSGAWSHTGTYIEAAIRIAEAGGGYVQGDDTDQTLHVRPYYPSAPWDWAELTPDIQLPEDVCRTEGIEWVERTGYNSVWVTGARRDRIRRAGTDGLTVAQTIVDDLATDPIMTRQRGLRVLADTGRQALISVGLPVIPETGLIRPGPLVRYQEGGNTHLGLSRSLAIDYQFPNLWQSIKLETHPDEL